MTVVFRCMRSRFWFREDDIFSRVQRVSQDMTSNSELRRVASFATGKWKDLMDAARQQWTERPPSSQNYMACSSSDNDDRFGYLEDDNPRALLFDANCLSTSSGNISSPTSRKESGAEGQTGKVSIKRCSPKLGGKFFKRFGSKKSVKLKVNWSLKPWPNGTCNSSQLESSFQLCPSSISFGHPLTRVEFDQAQFSPSSSQAGFPPFGHLIQLEPSCFIIS